MGRGTGSMSWYCQPGCILLCCVWGHVLPFILPACISELLCLHREAVVVISCQTAQTLPGSCMKGPAASFCSRYFQRTPALCWPGCFCGSATKPLWRGARSVRSPAATAGLGTGPVRAGGGS